MEALEKKVRGKISELFEADKGIEEIFKKMRTKSATYDDAHQFALAMGQIITESISEDVAQIVSTDEILEYVLGNVMNNGYRLTSLICDSVQTNLNELAGVGMNPVKTKLNKDRVVGIMDLMRNTDDAEKMNLLFQSKFNNLIQSFVDDYVQTNAEFQTNAGMNPIIVRKWSGRRPSHDTRHTDLCESMAGTFDYDNLPTFGKGVSVFARHEGCNCSVSYYPNRLAKGRITALSKGQQDKSKDLWNTGVYTSTNRAAILQRRRKQYGKEEARRILNEEWRDGLFGLPERHFT